MVNESSSIRASFKTATESSTNRTCISCQVHAQSIWLAAPHCSILSLFLPSAAGLITSTLFASNPITFKEPEGSSVSRTCCTPSGQSRTHSPYLFQRIFNQTTRELHSLRGLTDISFLQTLKTYSPAPIADDHFHSSRPPVTRFVSSPSRSVFAEAPKLHSENVCRVFAKGNMYRRDLAIYIGA